MSPAVPLLTPADPAPVLTDNPGGASPILLLGDHAGNAIPASLNGLGVGAADLARHIGWDIGVRALGADLAWRLDAVFIHQAYSRLVIDCNRDPARHDSIPEASDGTSIPGNRPLSAEDRAARRALIHEPYHAAIAAEIARRRAAGRPVILIALHSFTPAMGGQARPWDIGLLHDAGDTAPAQFLLRHFGANPDLCVGDNQPYRMDSTDYTIPRHAYGPRIPYAELELRQDHLSTPEGVARWTDLLAAALRDMQRAL